MTRLATRQSAFCRLLLHTVNDERTRTNDRIPTWGAEGCSRMNRDCAAVLAMDSWRFLNSQRRIGKERVAGGGEFSSAAIGMMGAELAVAGSRPGKRRLGIGAAWKSFWQGMAMRRAQELAFLRRALSVAMPVLAYIWR